MTPIESDMIRLVFEKNLSGYHVKNGWGIETPAAQANCPGMKRTCTKGRTSTVGSRDATYFTLMIKAINCYILCDKWVRVSGKQC